MQGLIDGMRCGILAVDRSSRIMLVNDLAASILDLRPAPAAGTPLAEALAVHPQLIGVMEHAFAVDALPCRAQVDVNPGEVNSKTVGFTVSLVRDATGDVVGAAMFFKDLTPIECHEEQDRLHDRLAALGEMAASMAHEIRNPLASIDVSCALLKRRIGDDEDNAAMLQRIASEVQRLNQCVTSSLEFVRPVPLDFEIADPLSLLDEAIRVAVQRADKPGVLVQQKYSDTVTPFLIDPVSLRQVFENLVLNALEAMGPEGRVTVEAETLPAPSSPIVPYHPNGQARGDAWSRAERLAVFRVSDSGPGIPSHERARVFFPFYTTKSEGSGVGLAMAKKIVDRHRGLIDVTESSTGGAMFTVRLPMLNSVSED
ncbi:MAG: PAS domain-containing protein [bacterium]|nr:PAS domain-containing protein [bacterium]